MRVGFEIEVEDVEDIISNVPGINVVPDDSLRNGVEFVSDVLPDEDFAVALYTYMWNRIKGNYSDRCGFHFHLDFVGKDKEFIIKFLTRYLSIERTLFAVYPNILRPNNNFCKLLLDSPDELSIIRNIQHGDDISAEVLNFSKYSALNIRTLESIGTVEFRAAAGGTTPEEFCSLLNVFTMLYDVDGPLPLRDQITSEHSSEAAAQVQLIHTAVATDDLGEYFGLHFESAPTSAITTTTIQDYLATR